MILQHECYYLRKEQPKWNQHWIFKLGQLQQYFSNIILFQVWILFVCSFADESWIYSEYFVCFDIDSGSEHMGCRIFPATKLASRTCSNKWHELRKWHHYRKWHHHSDFSSKCYINYIAMKARPYLLTF